MEKIETRRVTPLSDEKMNPPFSSPEYRTMKLVRMDAACSEMMRGWKIIAYPKRVKNMTDPSMKTMSV